MTIKEQVKEILIKYPKTRDSDRALEWRYWIIYDKLMKTNNMVMSWDEYSKATPSSTIRRARRQVQADNPELRGSTWVQEKRKAIEKTKGQFINEPKNTYADQVEQIRNQALFRPSSYGKWIKDGDINDIPDKIK